MSKIRTPLAVLTATGALTGASLAIPVQAQAADYAFSCSIGVGTWYDWA